MKRSLSVEITLLFFAFACAAAAQVPVSAPDIEVVKYSWSKERIGWEKDPFNATGENFYTMRDRVARERRPRSAIEEKNMSVAKEEQNKPSKPPRYVFSYKVLINNLGKEIKEIDWDYVFSDAANGQELGRRQFTSVETIGASKRKELSLLASTPPTDRISVTTLGKNEHDGLTEKIVIVAIRYSDGTAWIAP